MVLHGKEAITVPTVKPTSSIVFDSQELLDHIDAFKFNNYFANRSQAVMFLLHTAMESLKDQYPELDMKTKLETKKPPVAVVSDQPKP